MGLKTWMFGEQLSELADYLKELVIIQGSVLLHVNKLC